MTEQQRQPEYLAQGINYLGFLAQQLGDLRGITTLAHELIQNADDAKDESGELAASQIAFDITDEALTVSNDARFLKPDFAAMQDVASGTKRFRPGARTTGAFGIGFISVYQITDRPELFSSGEHWILRPEQDERYRIEVHRDGYTCEWCARPIQGTVFRLPWAFSNSEVRKGLRVPPVDREDLEVFTKELAAALPRSILFLKQLEAIQLFRDGEVVTNISRARNGEKTVVDHNGTRHTWRVLHGAFRQEANALKDRYGTYIDANRDDRVQIAIPEAPLSDGLLFATLPTESSIGLPFHIDADFFPDSDRKSIVFGDTYDHRSEWNREAMRAAARTVASNLPGLLSLFKEHPLGLWSLLERLYQIYHERRDDKRVPLAAFWERLAGLLHDHATVFTESGKWLRPSAVRIPTGEAEEQSVPVFEALGIEIVNKNLRKYRNLLTSGTVGVQPIRPQDLSECFGRLGLVEGPKEISALPEGFKTPEGLRSIWAAVEPIVSGYRGQDRHAALSKLSGYSFAPGEDGRLWPCVSAYRTDDETRRLFGRLLTGVVFLSDFQDSEAAKILCPSFSAEMAIEHLSLIDAQKLQTSWQRGEFHPASVLRWFEDRNHWTWFLSEEGKEQLAALPIFPSSSGHLMPLTDLVLPGGDFVDPLGMSQLVDIAKLPRLHSFLEDLGAQTLDFGEYAKSYIPKAFAEAEPAKKRQLILLLARHIGEMREDSNQEREIRRALAAAPLIECPDGTFARPSRVYMPESEAQDIFRNLVRYAALPQDRQEGIIDLYKWLGVADRPRPQDLIEIVQQIADKKPGVATKQIVLRIVEKLGPRFVRMAEEQKARYERLKSMAWLPAERDNSRWYQPGGLYASYNKSLFESQANFIDAPMRVQHSAREFLGFLGINISPKPLLVVRHLLECVKQDVDPPDGIYDWLNNNASPHDLGQLKQAPCLRIEGKYYRPDQVFWGDHPFGRFRKKLGENLRRVSKFLDALNIREAPDHSDAILVLKEISSEIGNRPLGQDREVVLQCWILLSEGLGDGKVTPTQLTHELGEIKSVPNVQDLLMPPAWMFFEDRHGLAEQFPDFLPNNTIRKPERAWSAMQAAGVKPISQAVTGELVAAPQAREDSLLTQRLRDRIDLVRRITEGLDGLDADGPPINRIKFIKAERLSVVWHVDAFRQKRRTDPQKVSSHLVRSEGTIYFAPIGAEYPWTSLARDLALALAPGSETRSLSPGLKMVLEPDDKGEAAEQLNEMGIAVIEAISSGPRTGGPPAVSFDERRVEDQHVGVQESRSEEALHETDEEDVGYDTVGHGESDEESLDQHSSDLSTRGDGTSREYQRDAERISATRQDEKVSFLQKLFEAQVQNPPEAPSRHVQITEGGPKTGESAAEHTRQSIERGRQGEYVDRVTRRWQPTIAEQKRADEFKSMVRGDYGERCQICGNTFRERNGEPQLFVVHLIPPSGHPLTNHFGDLVGLCGWHYALVMFGRWTFLDPSTQQPGASPGHLKNIVLDAPERVEQTGNRYKAILIRFWNVYPQWQPEPESPIEEIRYSIPHWTYLRELLTTGGETK